MTIAEFVNKVGFVVDEKSVKTVNEKINRIGSTAQKILGALGISLSLSAMNQLIEEFSAVNNSIKSAVGNAENLNEVQNQILESANEARVSYSLMANTVSDLVKSSKDMFSVSEASQFSENIAKLLKSSGRDDSTIQNVMDGLNKSFQKGIVESETLNVLLEQAPEAANILADKLKVSKSALLDMASTGAIKVNDLKDAFLSATEQINESFSEVDLTITGALQAIRNKWGLWLTQTNEKLGATKTIAKFMITSFESLMKVLNKVSDFLVKVTNKLGGFENLLKLVAIVGGSLWAVFNFKKIVAGFSAISGILGKINLKMLAIIGVVGFLVLLVEDFIAFMQGKKSVIGDFLDSTFGKNIINFWKPILESIGEFFTGIVKAFDIGMSQLFGEDWTAFKESFNEAFEDFKEDFGEIIDLVKEGKLEEAFIKIGENIEETWSSLFETLDRIFGTNFSEWNDKVNQFFRGFGSYLYAITHEDELKALEEDGKYGSLDTEVQQLSNYYMRSGMGSAEALQKAKNVLLDTDEKLAYFNTHFLSTINEEDADARMKQMKSDGNLNLSYYSDEEIAHLSQYASGTNYSDRDFIAGEEGPELITNQKGRKVYDALQTGNILRNMQALANARYVSPSTAAVTTNNSETVSIVQNVEINNEFNGEKSIQREASSVMEKSADDVTARLARGLAYAR